MYRMYQIHSAEEAQAPNENEIAISVEGGERPTSVHEARFVTEIRVQIYKKRVRIP